jgi:hypothetical protein
MNTDIVDLELRECFDSMAVWRSAACRRDGVLLDAKGSILSSWVLRMEHEPKGNVSSDVKPQRP